MHKDSFLSLVRLGIGHPTGAIPESVDWPEMRTIAKAQGLLGVITDGIGCLPVEKRPQKKELMQWIGGTVKEETRYMGQKKSAAEMALLLQENGIKSYVLKGAVVAECYPRPDHRASVDLDCFLLPLKGTFDAWTLGNELIKLSGYKASVGFYKNSTFRLPGLTVENHKFMTPFRGNSTLKRLEVLLQDMMQNDKGEDRFEGTWLYRPPVMASALFLIEHAYSHFLHEGLTWRHVLDWRMFSRRHHEVIDWNEIDARIDEFGLRRFYDSYSHLGGYIMGEVKEAELTDSDKRMLADIWSDLDLHETLHGIKGKLALVGNTLRARWKYKYFSEISMIHALWIQVKGFLFIKHPTLE